MSSGPRTIAQPALMTTNTSSMLKPRKSVGKFWRTIKPTSTGVGLAVGVGVMVGVAVADEVAVAVGVALWVAVSVTVGVAGTGVCVAVSVGRIGVAVGSARSDVISVLEESASVLVSSLVSESG